MFIAQFRYHSNIFILTAKLLSTVKKRKFSVDVIAASYTNTSPPKKTSLWKLERPKPHKSREGKGKTSPVQTQRHASTLNYID